MKRTKLYPSLNWKCARCHEGDLFKFKNPYHPRKFDEMYEHCPNCGLKYERELGFWYGAMYVSYALTVALSVATFIATWVLFNPENVWVYIWAIATVLVVMVPLVYRTSRAIWLAMFVKYRPPEERARS